MSLASFRAALWAGLTPIGGRAAGSCRAPRLVKRGLTTLALSAGLVGLLGVDPASAVQVQAAPEPGVAKPVVNILCKYNDISDTYGTTAADIQTMFTGTPGLDSYIQEESYGAVNFSGTQSYGWYTLPGTGASYLPTDNIYTEHPALAQACVSAAEADVNFSSFSIIQLWFNNPDLGRSMGFTNRNLSLTLNGKTARHPVSLESSAALTSPSLAAHELGHTFGMQHATDESSTSVWGWDPLAAALLNGPLGPGYLAYHRDVAGWMPSAKKFTYKGNGSQTVMLDPLTGSGAGTYLVAEVPLSNGQLYSVEYRRKVGYDAAIADEGVLINLITPGGGPTGFDEMMQSAGGGTGDEAELWRPGESFWDSTNHVGIRVILVTDSAAKIMIEGNRTEPMPAPPASLSVSGQTNTDLTVSWAGVDTKSAASILLQHRPSGTTEAWKQVKMQANLTSYQVTNLNPSTAYDVTLQACWGGTNDCSAQATLSTSTTGPSPASPTNVQTGNVTTTGFQLSWTSAANANQYRITLGTAPSMSGGSCNTPTNQSILVPAQATSYTATGLSPNTVYCGWVTAVNGTGSTDSWPWFFVTTPAS